MHRVLSYQTAMQINDDRDIRAYITKQTCISLIFSVSFFTLIIGKQTISNIIYFDHCLDGFQFHFNFLFSTFEGFLLGKFVSDRNLKIKQLQQPEYFTKIQQLQLLRQSIEMNAVNVSESHIQFKHPELNRRLWKAVDSSCKHLTIEPNFHEDFELFAAKLADNELHNYSECLARLVTAVKDTGIGFD